ncbi:MAG: uncharacterized protein QOH21_1845, partial [Acidobacteriota bacterium]|nr:uncharacterized protein [Acidobacteriota bacterium]
GALAQSPLPRDFAVPETISVSGNGKTTLTPDRFSFSVGVQTVGKTVDEAVNENNRRVNSVLTALKAAGAEASNIQTSNFNVWPQQDYQEGRLPRILGYQVSNNITVRSSKIGDAGRLLGVAITAGVNTSTGLNFEVADPARGRDLGLRAAFDEARAKAAILAQAAGRTLGRALTISEGVQAQPPIYQPMQRTMAMESKAVSDVPVEAGTQEVSYTVSVVFELK